MTKPHRSPFAIEAESPVAPRRMLAVAIGLAISAASVGWIGSSFAESFDDTGDRRDRVMVSGERAGLVVASVDS